LKRKTDLLHGIGCWKKENIEYLTKFLWWEYWENAKNGKHRFCGYVLSTSYESLEAVETTIEIIKKISIPTIENTIKEFEI
jgi:hypothetical protein